jgi:hypothetical protein
MGFSELPLWLRVALVLAGLLFVVSGAISLVTGDGSEEGIDPMDARALVREAFVDSERIDDLTCERVGDDFRCTFRFEGRRCWTVVSDANGSQLDRCERPESPQVGTRALLLISRPGRPDSVEVGSGLRAQRLCDEMQDGEYDELLDRQRQIEITWPGSDGRSVTCPLPPRRR